MSDKARIICGVLRRLRDEYGDLNTAFVAYCLEAGGEDQTIASIARETGLSRDAVRRALHRCRFPTREVDPGKTQP